MSQPFRFTRPTFSSVDEERADRKAKLAAAFRLFSKFGYDQGIAGHITARDPGNAEHFWVNPYGMHFGHITVSDLVLVDSSGEIVEGSRPINSAAFAIHSQIHAARPDVIAAAHAHTLYGRAFAAYARPLSPISQDACVFYKDHTLFNQFGGLVIDLAEGKALAHALAEMKAIILQNHGLLTVGGSVDEAVWWFVALDRSCQTQMLAEASGVPTLIDDETAQRSHDQIGNPQSGWDAFQPLFEMISKEQPDLFD